MLARQASAAVGVGTCWPWETAATLPSARRRKALRRPRERRGAGAYLAAARLQLAFIYLFLKTFCFLFYTFPTMYCMYDFHDK